MARKQAAVSCAKSTAHIGFEAKLWLAADKLRNNMEAAEYKHVVLGLTAEPNVQFGESVKLEATIRKFLEG